MVWKLASALAVGLLAGAAVVTAQEHEHGAAGDPATEAYIAVNAAMHDAMAITYSGDPDVDFARSMIPHHEGAVAMAEVVLANGKDPRIRALAEGVVSTQRSEIAELKAWLAAHGAGA